MRLPFPPALWHIPPHGKEVADLLQPPPPARRASPARSLRCDLGARRRLLAETQPLCALEPGPHRSATVGVASRETRHAEQLLLEQLPWLRRARASGGLCRRRTPPPVGSGRFPNAPACVPTIPGGWPGVARQRNPGVDAVQLTGSRKLRLPREDPRTPR